ncbi:hypothetical protein SAMN05421740_105124 [Parapedobacter koreensis]|uniref:Uncharacterized protein n=1 Tax=Parapedobacter koreensis TaxID=332977 RepID=A0A1H7Q1U2_9SPHI|nr:hypothetical protein SAMN05421740_105124 [Parapedobacter koreensis]
MNFTGKWEDSLKSVCLLASYDTIMYEKPPYQITGQLLTLLTQIGE